MINVKVTTTSSNELFAEIDNKISGIKELTTTQTERQLLDVAFSISALKFVKKTNLIARSNKEAFHHVYEWNGTGKETDRLFRVIKRSMSSGSASIYYKFNNSKKNAPISPQLSTPGPTGKVVTKTGVFKRKAEIMESGRPVSFITQKTIAIPSGSGIKFIPSGKIINIKSPGGTATSGAFERHFQTWWNINFPNALEERGVIQSLENAVARSLQRKRAGAAASRNAISSTLSRYKIIGSVV